MFASKVFPVIINLVVCVLMIRLRNVDAFHLSFGNRLVKSIQNSADANQQASLHQYSATNPLLNPPENLIRPIECRNANNHSEAGICMFSIDCMQNKGVPLSICKHNYFVGTCCKLPDHNNFVGIVYDLRETEQSGVPKQQALEARRGSSDALHIFKSSPPSDLSTSTTTTINDSALASVASNHDTASTEPTNTTTTTTILLDDTNQKYLISSTKLFPASETAATLALDESPSAIKPPSGETARTADGPFQQQQPPQPQPPSHISIDEIPQNLANNSAYELLAAPTAHTNKSNSITSVVQQQEQPIELKSTTLATSTSTLISSTSASTDQEFTLSTGQSSGSVSSTQPEAASTNPSEPAPTPSNHFDLVSSSSSPTSSLSPSSSSSSMLPSPTESPSASSIYQRETTTPFTSSLSTAILPNISSMAPPTGRPEQVSPSSQQPDQQTPQTLVSTTTSAATTPASSVAPLPPQPQHSYAHRPLSATNLQVASKIVTGNSASNNLIPGLSGLQSAILAHIPFKIATGLSSGLSSYLQAAMKPGGGAPHASGRPLIASNTATALSYQAHLQNQTAKPASVRFPLGSSTTSTEAPAGQQLKRDVVKEAQLVCGKPRVSELTRASKRMARIVGGNQSTFGQWPWMVSLRQWRKGAFLHKCGAALLNENWAITAAHCVENVKAPDLLLRLGEFDVSNQNEPFPYIERRVKTVVSHPSFDPKTFEYDLALIKFAEPIQYERNIIPVCVPQGNDSYVDRMATVIGWGRLYEDGPLPDVIQHVDVPIITNQECEKMYKSAGFVEEIPDMFICAGISKGGRDSCEGDSGGPLTMVDHDGRSYLLGIISWGIGCALPSQPGVYTRITAFSSWINQITSS